MSSRTIPADGQRALFLPESSWSPPAELPALAGVDVAIDTETRDSALAHDRGAGWLFDDWWDNGESYLLGVSAAWDGGSLYAPVRHPDTNNFPLEQVISWVDHLCRHCRVHMFHAGYDLGWLRASGLETWPERLEDAQAACVMIDENYDDYSLEACCARAEIPGKDEVLLREAAAALGVMPVRGSIKHGLWRMPARYVGPYAEGDADRTLRLSRWAAPRLAEESIETAYRTEVELIEVVHHMRRRGIRISDEALVAAVQEVGRLEMDALYILSTTYAPPGWRRGVLREDLRSPARLAQIFDAEGIQYERTPKTRAPSFTRQWLEAQTSPVGKLVRRARQLADLKEKFLMTYVGTYINNDRIHAEVHALRDEAGGARTLRFSYSNPPLQQMPSRDPELAPLIRGVFLPEEGERWLAADYSQQEPRLNLHFAHRAASHARRLGIEITGTQAWVDRYRSDPHTDYHNLSAEFLKLPRKSCKDMNQAIAYRAGADKVADMMGLGVERATEMVEEYHRRIPWVRGIAQYAERVAKQRGYVRMIDGARRHYPFWQPKRLRGLAYARGEVAARERWPGMSLERAHCYQAGNSVVQGSAARQVKIAMLRAYRAGYLPLVTMHDEIGFSVTSARQCEEIRDIMLGAVDLVVPMAVDLELGPSWGTAKVDYRKAF